MALRDWTGWEIALLWLGGLGIAGLLVWRSAQAFRGHATSGEGGIHGYAVHFSGPLVFALFVIAAALAAVTVIWLRSRGGGGA